MSTITNIDISEKKQETEEGKLRLVEDEVKRVKTKLNELIRYLNEQEKTNALTPKERLLVQLRQNGSLISECDTKIIGMNTVTPSLFNLGPTYGQTIGIKTEEDQMKENCLRLLNEQKARLIEERQIMLDEIKRL